MRLSLLFAACFMVGCSTARIDRADIKYLRYQPGYGSMDGELVSEVTKSYLQYTLKMAVRDAFHDAKEPHVFIPEGASSGKLAYSYRHGDTLIGPCHDDKAEQYAFAYLAKDGKIGVSIGTVQAPKGGIVCEIQ